MNYWIERQRDTPHILIVSNTQVVVYAATKGYLSKNGEWNSKGLDLKQRTDSFQYSYEHAVQLLKKLGYKRYFSLMWAENSKRLLFYIDD